MILDSHAHYCHRRYEGAFSCIDEQNGAFSTDLEGLVERMIRQDIAGWIEPGTSMEALPGQFALAQRFPGRVWLAPGLHPQHCTKDLWPLREALEDYAARARVVAIGETGLDFHRDPAMWDGDAQKMWFAYQIDLAHRHALPLILHIRQAHREAVEILRAHRSLLHGGVAHCFGGSYEEAAELVDLGFAVGIGGRVLWEDPVLFDAVRRLPREALLVETDAPYILPDLRGADMSGKQRKRLRNSSMILPAVIGKMALLRGEDPAALEEAVYENTCRIFGL